MTHAPLLALWLSRWNNGDFNPKVVVSNSTLFRVCLCPHVGPSPPYGATLKGGVLEFA